MPSETSFIRTSFSRAATTYDENAEIQRRIARKLLDRLPEQMESLLDAGCGTAFLRPELSTRCEDYFGLDSAFAMLNQQPGPGQICADLTTLPLRSQSVTHYYSSLAWQWVSSDEACAEAMRILKPGGGLTVATLGPRTMHELKTAFSHADGIDHVRQFETPAQLQNALYKNGFSAIELHREMMLDYAADLPQLLRRIKAIGANVIGTVRPPGLFGRTRFLRANAAYESMRSSQGLPLSYDVIYLLAKKAL